MLREVTQPAGGTRLPRGRAGDRPRLRAPKLVLLHSLGCPRRGTAGGVGGNRPGAPFSVRDQPGTGSGSLSSPPCFSRVSFLLPPPGRPPDLLHLPPPGLSGPFSSPPFLSPVALPLPPTSPAAGRWDQSRPSMAPSGKPGRCRHVILDWVPPETGPGIRVRGQEVGLGGGSHGRQGGDVGK